MLSRLNIFLNIRIMLLALALTGCNLAKNNDAPSKPIDTKKPNVILIFADDISAREFEVYGSSTWTDPLGDNTSDIAYRAKTPVINKIANEGVWVSNAWGATVCSPSRAMMMTGRYAAKHKWWNNNDLGRVGGDPKGPILPLYQSSPHLIGHVAKNAGYSTYWTGKTQMKGGDMTQYGFDEGTFTPGEPYWVPQKEVPYKRKGTLTDFRLVRTNTPSGEIKQINEDTGTLVQSYAQTSFYWQPAVQLMNHPETNETFVDWPYKTDEVANYGLTTYGPEIEIDLANDFIDRSIENEEPFFIYHTTHLGHDGFNWLNPKDPSKWPGTPKLVWDGEKYTQLPVNITGDSGKYDTHGTVTESGIHRHIEYLDYQVWRYIQKLEQKGILDNTIIILSADNGTWKYGKHSHDRQKGTHVPFIVYAPNGMLTKAGKQDILVSVSDILPTLADIMGSQLPANYEIHGESFWPYLTTPITTPHRDWIYTDKNHRQLVRGHLVMKDGNDRWWDVSKVPSDLISFPEITDWDIVSSAHRKERDQILKEIKPLAVYYSERH